MIFTTKIILFSSIFYIVMSRHLDFRERFLERKRLRALNAHRVNVLNKIENLVILDDITHYRRFKGRSLQKKRGIEKDFRRLIAMDGVKYTYKRDLFWRTWRSIPLLVGATKEIVCYKCNNNLKSPNGTIHQNCGTWSIEESTPPCPFEFFSLKSDRSFCGANITQYKDVKHNCPSVIKFSDLTATCDNPIETQWRFTKLYGVTEEHENFICKDQDFCEIFTSYEITPEHVVFRIINSTNDVIYSRIMKSKKNNYICIEDCGHFNPETRKVTKVNSKPLKLDLLGHKIKRNLLNEFITKKELLNEISENITKRQVLLKGSNQNITKRKKLLDEIVEKREELNDSETKRAVLNKTNVSDMIRDEVLNEINKSDAKDDIENEINDIDTEDLVNETNESHTRTDELVNEISDTDANEDVLNDSAHLSATKTDKLINELLPMEEDLSTLNWGGSEFDIVSVEVNALHNIKFGGEQINFTIEKGNNIYIPRTATGQKNTLVYKKEKHSDGIIRDKPTVTPRMKLKKKQNFVSYEDDNQELGYE